MATYEQMKNEFYAMPKLAFECIDEKDPSPATARREAFIAALEKRCEDPQVGGGWNHPGSLGGHDG